MCARAGEADQLRALVGRVGGGAIEGLEATLHESEDARWACMVEIERLRAESQWRAQARQIRARFSHTFPLGFCF